MPSSVLPSRSKTPDKCYCLTDSVFRLKFQRPLAFRLRLFILVLVAQVGPVISVDEIIVRIDRQGVVINRRAVFPISQLLPRRRG